MFIKVKFRTQLMTNIYHRKSCELDSVKRLYNVSTKLFVSAFELTNN